MMDYIVAFLLVFLVAFFVTTAQLAAAKNKFDYKWNNKYGHRWGNWCYLCVGFWLGALITAALCWGVGGITIPQYFIVIFAQPAISTFLTLKII